MDLVGPLPVQGHKRERYFLTIVDDWSRLMWAYPLKQKDHAASTIKEDWLPFVKKQAECVVKRIRTDRGGEFLGAEMTAWLKKQGIQRELTTAYTPQSNGVAERANRTILETARALLIESGVGNSMWPHAVQHATVARNRVLTKVGNESWVPLERWLGRKPPVDMLRVFGCMAVAHVPKKYRSKLGASAIWCVHLGLAAESKGWLLWEPSKGVLFDSRDVKFVEGMMYGGWKKQPLHQHESSAQDRSGSQDSGVSAARGARTNQGSLIKEVLKNFTVEKFNGVDCVEDAAHPDLRCRNVDAGEGAVRVALERGRAGATCFGQNARPLRKVGNRGNHLPGVDQVLEDAIAAAGIVASIHERIEPAAEPELVDARVGADKDSGGGLPSPPTEGWRRRQQRLRDAREKTWQRTWLLWCWKDDDSNDQQGGTGWGRGAKSGCGGKSGAGGKMKGSCWYCEKEGHPWFLCYKKPDGWTPQNRHQDGGARRNQKNGVNMVSDSSDNNPKSNGGAEKKKERTAGQFFHIGEQGEQGDASAK
ncbi:unnamed protein product, partial [Closterium sp. NIES-54]